MSPSALQPVQQYPSLRDDVQQMLSAGIISGELAPGELLTVPTLASRFGVSATPVREAMLALVRHGFVEPVRNKGFRVTVVSERTIRDIVAVRLMLEPTAMRTLAGEFTVAESKRMRPLADAIVVSAHGGDLTGYLRSDHIFHLELMRLLGNQVLTETVAELRGRTRLVGLAAMVHSDQLELSAHEHTDLLGLLESGDGESTETLMRKHLQHVLGWWSGRQEPDTRTRK